MAIACASVFALSPRLGSWCYPSCYLLSTHANEHAMEVTQYALAASGPVTRRWTYRGDVPKRLAAAADTSLQSQHTPKRRLMHGCASRPRGSPDQHVKRAILTFSHVSRPPFLSTSHALPLRTSSRELRTPPCQRTSKDKDRAPQKSGGSGVPSSPRRTIPRRSCSSEASGAWLQFSAGPLACLGTCELECGFRLNVC